jgi:hypothetical protein
LENEARTEDQFGGGDARRFHFHVGALGNRPEIPGGKTSGPVVGVHRHSGLPVVLFGTRRLRGLCGQHRDKPPLQTPFD